MLMKSIDNLLCGSGIFSVAKIVTARKSIKVCSIIVHIGKQDSHQLSVTIRKSKATPILILASQFCHAEHMWVFRQGAHAYI